MITVPQIAREITVTKEPIRTILKVSVDKKLVMIKLVNQIVY